MFPRRIACLLLLGALGCAPLMHQQVRYDPLEASERFPDGTSARAPVPGTVPRESPPAGEPERYTREMLERGRVHYEVNCSPCHGLAGFGDGMVMRRGFPRPPSLHEARLREAPDAHFWSVMTNGVGLMYPYADRVTPQERWEIVGYVRVLQLSQAAPVQLLTPDERRRLEALP